MSYQQFWGWMEFNRLNPFLEERGDYQAASIVSMLHNVNTVEKANLKSPRDFMLPSMDETIERELKEKEDEEARQETIEDQQAAWKAFINNLTSGRKPQQTVFKG